MKAGHLSQAGPARSVLKGLGYADAYCERLAPGCQPTEESWYPAVQFPTPELCTGIRAAVAAHSDHHLRVKDGNGVQESAAQNTAEGA